MKLKSIKLTDYRNFSDVSFSFAPSGTILHGANGIGKTNLLEAIAFFSFGKSIRFSPDSQCIRFGCDFFRLEAIFEANRQTTCLEIAVSRTGRKIIKQDGVGLEKLSELYSLIKAVYFSPADIAIVSDSPMVRRKFLNLAISHYDPAYIPLLHQYNKVLKQRNTLLKESFEVAEKKSWDEQYIKYSGEVYRHRASYLAKFLPLVATLYHEISGGQERVRIRYKSTVNVDDYANSLAELLARDGPKEISYERSLHGIHLDDLAIYLDEKKARDYGSQGQQRSLSIALRLAQVKMLDLQASAAILMFDDVLSELDMERRTHIMSLLGQNHQIFIASPQLGDYAETRLYKHELKAPQKVASTTAENVSK